VHVARVCAAAGVTTCSPCRPSPLPGLLGALPVADVVLLVVAVVVVVNDDNDDDVVVVVVVVVVMLFKRPSRLLMYVATMHYEMHSQCGDCDASVGSSGGSGFCALFENKSSDWCANVVMFVVVQFGGGGGDGDGVCDSGGGVCGFGACIGGGTATAAAAAAAAAAVVVVVVVVSASLRRTRLLMSVAT